MLASRLAVPSPLKMEATTDYTVLCSEDRTVRNKRSENLKSYEHFARLRVISTNPDGAPC